MFTTQRLFRALGAVVPAFGLLFSSRGDGTLQTALSNRMETSSFTVTISGKIIEAASGKPIGGAQLTIASSTIGALSGTDGQYVLTVPKVTIGDTLHLNIRRIGFGSVAVLPKVTAEAMHLDIAMKATNLQLTSVNVAAKSRALGAVGASPPMTYAPSQTLAKRNGGAYSRADASSRTMMRDELRSNIRRTPGEHEYNREQYDRIEDNPFLAVSGNPLSTFSIDVDRASYGNVRRFLTQRLKPPADAVRIEEMVNYFPYTLDAPHGDDPIAVTTEVSAAPWQTQHRLVRIALQARRIETAALPPNNLVFLIDVSGSMEEPDKLPLVKESLRLLVNQLREQDHVALVAYAGNAGLVLPSTSGANKARIAEAIDRLEAGGSTAGGAGLELAYRVARENFLKNGNNRVILATDGDFNVGPSSDAEMERLIESKRSEGTYLTVLGFGTGNYQDAKMEKLAKKGNGNYAYVDDIAEARKTLVHELGATLFTVANDVKLQVEFNPSAVAAYRLIGYEDRLMRNEDFADDKKDAGDIGAGHSVTALYEVVPVGVKGTTSIRGADSLRYLQSKPALVRTSSDELLFVKLRYKRPGESTSRLMTQTVANKTSAKTSDDFRWAASVAEFGMLLRDSEHKGNASSNAVLEMARGAVGDDAGGYRAEFLKLVQRWQDVTKGIATRGN